MNNAFSVINKYFKQKYLLKNNLVTQRPKYLCGISGGQDSIFLFFWLLHLKNKWNFNLSILHCHHLWQQSNFLAFQQIYKLAYIFKTPICINLSESVFFTETSARNWRQEAYNRSLIFENGDKFILGHTATDQLETALLNLIRGTSPQGFCSLKQSKKLIISLYIYIFPSYFFKFSPKKFTAKTVKNKCYLKSKFFSKQVFTSKLKKNNIKTVDFLFCYNLIKFNGFGSSFKLNGNYIYFSFFISYQRQKKNSLYNVLIRPLLFLHRNDITVLSKFYHIPIINDFSNYNVVFSRNKLRHQIFPKFRSLFHLPFDYKFYQYLQILLDEQDYMDNIVINLIKKRKYCENEKFKELPIALQRRYIHFVLESYIKKKCNYFQIEYIQSILLFD